MKKIIGYLRAFLAGQHRTVFLLGTVFTAVAVFVNYRYGLNAALYRLSAPWAFLSWYALFLVVFGCGYGLQYAFTKNSRLRSSQFVALLLLAPAVFAWKMTAQLNLELSDDPLANDYWNDVLYWPFKVAVITAMLGLLHARFHRGQSFYGLTVSGFNARPYLGMLLLMLPLVTAAATQPDFLRLYPRFASVAYLQQPQRTAEILLYELSYGSDFFSIELFFRGFLVLGFSRWAGRDAVLPMAMFYCTIHFGKPMGECISSYFGGLILGVVSYHTRSIFGGFLVHVGLAWLMELGGHLGQSYF